MSEVEQILAAHDKLGEGSLWSVDEQVLYWVDIQNNCYRRFNPISGTHETVNVGVPIGVMALRASGGLIMATRDGFATWDEQAQQLHYLAQPEIDKPSMRFNDGAVDSGGRFWAGTMNVNEGPSNMNGTLYRLDPDGSLHTIETGLGVPNGIGWSPDDTTMYFTDSTPHTIYAYDYDAATGNVANRRVLVQTSEEIGAPDGLTVDSEGYIWSACWDGAKIVRYTPDGQIDRIVPVPALRPTSCTFGGASMDELYITSAWTGMSEEQIERYPLSGDLFRLKPGVTGPARHKFGG